MTYRSDALRKLCFGQNCYLQIPGVCQTAPTVPAHANWSWSGKGKSVKADDVYTCPACDMCHFAIDQGSKLTRAEREHYWMRGWVRWVLHLFISGAVVVAGEAPKLAREYAPLPKIFPRGARIV